MEDAERKKEKKKETATKIFWPPFFSFKKVIHEMFAYQLESVCI